MTIKESIKNLVNTRMDEKTGKHYIKGEKAHKGSIAGSMHEMEYESDPNLKSDERYKEHR
jgi:hypothetical protein